MKPYIGTKQILAKPMTRLAYNEYRNWELPSNENGADEGMLVEYLDGGKPNHPNHKGYISWSPKDVFERAYLGLEKVNSISPSDVDSFIKSVRSRKVGNKTTVTIVTLVNGFEITETSACVDPNNFDMGIGEAICVNRAKDKIWELLGFLLQTSINGIK